MSDLLRNAHFFLQSLSWRDALDVLVVAFLLYQLLKLIRGTQAVQLLLGLGVIFAVGWAAQLLHLRLLEFIFNNGTQAIVIAAIVLAAIVVLIVANLSRRALPRLPARCPIVSRTRCCCASRA